MLRGCVKLRIPLALFRDRIIQHVLEPTAYLYEYRSKLDFSLVTKTSINHPILLDMPSTSLYGYSSS